MQPTGNPMKVLKLIAAAALAATIGTAANASPFGVYSAPQEVIDLLKNPAVAAGGSLFATGDAVAITYLGHSAVYTNSLLQANFGSMPLFVNLTSNLNTVQIISGFVPPEIVKFSLNVDLQGDNITDYVLSTGTQFAKLVTFGGNTYLGFEDQRNWNTSVGGDMDYNDLVFKVGGVTNVAPIPEPSTYALMLAGLASVGFMARRRSASKK
jgi:hypothetical protein